MVVIEIKLTNQREMLMLSLLGDCEVRDYKGRTPLHLAAELDRSAAAECLISVPISAEVRVQDNVGNHAIASMIRTMPHVVRILLQLQDDSDPMFCRLCKLLINYIGLHLLSGSSISS